MSDLALMQSIKTRWEKEITTAIFDTPIPAGFIAALIANESGGNPDASRFEKAVYVRLQTKFPNWDDNRIEANATSWGLTQIMGINYPGTPESLRIPSVSLSFTVKMLKDFARRWKLDLATDAEKLFHCWNTGQPDHPTYDPNYVTNGLSRMQLWLTL